MDMRALAVPIKNDESEQVEPNRNKAPRWPVGERVCLIVNDGLPHAISPPVDLCALPNGSGSPISPSSKQSSSPLNAQELGVKSGVVNGQPVETLDSRSLSALGPQSRALVRPVEGANAWKFESKGFQSPMQDETGSKGGVLRGVGGLFRLPTQPCGTSTHTPPKNFYIFSMTHTQRKEDTVDQDAALAAIVADNERAEQRALTALKVAGDALLAKPRSPAAKRTYRDAQAKLADVRLFNEQRVEHFTKKETTPWPNC